MRVGNRKFTSPPINELRSFAKEPLALKSHTKSVPRGIEFDPAKLPDSACLTTREVAAWARFAIVTLEKWRACDRGPPAIFIEGSVRYRVGDVRLWLGQGMSRLSGPCEEVQAAQPHGGKDDRPEVTPNCRVGEPSSDRKRPRRGPPRHTSSAPKSDSD